MQNKCVPKFPKVFCKHLVGNPSRDGLRAGHFSTKEVGVFQTSPPSRFIRASSQDPPVSQEISKTERRIFLFSKLFLTVVSFAVGHSKVCDPFFHPPPRSLQAAFSCNLQEVRAYFKAQLWLTAQGFWCCSRESVQGCCRAAGHKEGKCVLSLILCSVT